jgi:uncharacterized repeat protein (TIGR01451 family)
LKITCFFYLPELALLLPTDMKSFLSYLRKIDRPERNLGSHKNSRSIDLHSLLPTSWSQRATFRKILAIATLSSLAIPSAAIADGIYMTEMTTTLTQSSINTLIDPLRTPGVKAGDIVEYVIKAKVADAKDDATGGPGIYLTTYIPAGVEVLGASFVTDATGATVRAPGQGGQANDGWGLRGSMTPFGTPFSTAGNSRQNDLYGDTGIFYSTDTRTQLYTADGSGIAKGPSVNPTNTASTSNGYNVYDTFYKAIDAFNLWDANQVNAFGRGGTINSVPTTDNPGNVNIINTKGQGATPFGSGSVVAGPDTGYKFDNTGSIGPWNRIQYSGSKIANISDGAATVIGINSTTGIDATATTNPATLDDASFLGATFPLSISPNAVRWSDGLRAVNDVVYIKIKVKITQAAIDATNGVLLNAEATGSDNYGSGSKDNPWRYFGLNVARSANLYVKKDIYKVNGAIYSGGLVPAGATLTYRIKYLNLGSLPVTNIAFSDTLPSPIATTGCTAANPTLGNLSNSVTISAVTPTATVLGCPGAGATVTFGNLPNVTGGSIPALRGGEFTYDLKISGAATNGTAIQNSANFTGLDVVSNTAAVTTPSVTTATVGVPILISGTVFEDINYGGGAGRSLTGSAGVGRGGVTVELYDAAGVLKKTTTTSSAAGTLGQYSFSLPSGNTAYKIRVVNSSVTSARTGSVAGLLPVQTFRTDASTLGTVNLVTSQVGGENPAKIDAVAGTTIDTTTLASLATATNTPQSVSSVNIASSSVAGIDFGYNFDTIVNTNNDGQGSLRQFILNSNALTGESSLPSGYETSIFMIPNGVANPGQNTSYTNQLTNQSTGGVAVINLVSALPDITGTKTKLDGSTQTVNVGNTNNGTLLGSIDKVGVDATVVPKFVRPEVEIKGKFTLTSTGSDNQIKNIAFNANRILVTGNNSLVQDNLVGMQADGTNNAITAGVPDHGIEVRTGNDITIAHNYVRVNESGIRGNNSGTHLTIEQNEVDLPSSGQTDTFDGILLIGSGSGHVVQNNLSKRMMGAGLELGFTGGSLTNTSIFNNTFEQNGYNGAVASAEPMGIVAYGVPNSSITISKNIIKTSSGSGVVILGQAGNTTGIKLTQNSIFGNGIGGNGLSIDLDPNSSGDGPNAYGPSDFVTPNTGTMSATLPNGGINYPIFTRVRRVGNTLKLAGFIGNSSAGNPAFAGARIEIYKADDDGNQNGQVVVGDNLSRPHGEGRDYIGYIIADANGLFNTTNTATPFVVDGISPTTLAATDKITATATTSAAATIAPNSTSEFSENVSLVTNDPQLVLVKRVTAIGSTAITTIVDDTRATSTAANDNNAKWPTTSGTTGGISNILQGSLNTSKVLPNQEIEYTIYFLSAGNVPIKTVNICDLIPINTTYVTGSGKISFNGAASTALSGEAIAAGAVLNTTVPGIGLCKSTSANAQTTTDLSAAENPNGLVWVQVDKNRSALAENEYGYIRFRVLTNANNPPLPVPPP